MWFDLSWFDEIFLGWIRLDSIWTQVGSIWSLTSTEVESLVQMISVDGLVHYRDFLYDFRIVDVAKADAQAPTPARSCVHGYNRAGRSYSVLCNRQPRSQVYRERVREDDRPLHVPPTAQ